MGRSRNIVGSVVLAGVATGLMTVAAFTATAGAQPAAPNCTTADVAGVAGGVSLSTSAYLFTHPEVNAFFTGLEGLPPEEIRNRVTVYLRDNPQTAAEIRGIRQPLIDLRARCGVSVPSMSDPLS